MEEPFRYEQDDPEKLVYFLKKVFNGLKQAARKW